MATSTVEQATHASGGTLSVRTRHARIFEPTGLGLYHARFVNFLQAIANQRQSDTLKAIGRERTACEQDASQESIAYCLALSVLADYIAFGNYPIIRNGRCFLIPVLESEGIQPERRRAMTQRLFCLARDRALADRGQLRWLEAAVSAMGQDRYRPAPVIAALGEGPPELRLVEARSTTRTLDARGLWRAVRITWSMGVESSAPGREVAFLAVDKRFPDIPLGIAQFRNVVPEIVARDRWLGISAAVSTRREALGYLRYLDAADAHDRLAGTREILVRLFANINQEGLPSDLRLGTDPRRLNDLANSQRLLFNERRKQGYADAKARLLVVKRAETAADLLRGIAALEFASASQNPLESLINNPDRLRDLNAGLRKVWHYHMGFVALEMSVCGAAPPFGPMRLGKLMAMTAASRNVFDAWGSDRPLGEIATGTYLASVRDSVPNPGPLVIFTSGLYPGHSAQYNRLQVGATRWRKIGETVGYGSFHVSLGTSRLAAKFNESVDGYQHVTRAFGEGASPRFREVGRAIARLGLPDLLRHEMARPLYALPLAADPQAVLLGWQGADITKPLGQPLDALSKAWWERWLAPRSTQLRADAAKAPDLSALLAGILHSASADMPTDH